MKFTIGQIKGALPDKKDLSNPKREWEWQESTGFNKCREIISTRQIGMNREKLARICHKNSGYGRGFGRKFNLMCASDQEVFYNEADAIIAAEADIIECKEDGK